jgi:4-amino-4-deoxy-L-arabinose transferase
MGIVIVGTANILDAPFAGMVTASIVAYFVALESKGSRRYALLAVAGLACGGAFLIKGLLAFVLPALVGGVYLAFSGRFRDLFITPWIPLLVALVIVLPWAIAIHLAEPEFWDHFIIGAHFQRFTAADGNQHSEPFWYYLMVLPIMAVPWTFAWPLAVLGLRGREGRRPWVLYATCWLIVPLIFLSLSSGKLPTYVMPLMAPIAALTAVGLVMWFDGHPSKRGFARYIPAVLMGLGALAIAVAPFVITTPKPLWDDGSAWRVYLFAGALVIWACLEASSVARGRRATSRLAWSVAAPVVLFMTLPIMFPTGLMSNMKMPADFLLKHRELLQENPVVTDERVGHGVAWVSGDREMRVIGERGDFGSFPEDDGPEPARFIEPGVLSGTFVFVLPSERLDRVLQSQSQMTVLERYDEDGLSIARIHAGE